MISMCLDNLSEFIKIIHPANIKLECTDSKCNGVYISHNVFSFLYITEMLWELRDLVVTLESLVHVQ